MFIGGLNWDTTDGTLFYITARDVAGPVVLKKAPFVVLSESLRKYFTQFGKVEACTIMRDAAGRSRCFAFLTFEEPQSVNAVMVREHFLDGKIVRRWVRRHYLVFSCTRRRRLIPNALSLVKNTSAPLSSSSAVSQAASPLSPCASFSPNLARS
jgi:RNA recognition motif-containing protein